MSQLDNFLNSPHLSLQHITFKSSHLRPSYVSPASAQLGGKAMSSAQPASGSSNSEPNVKFLNRKLDKTQLEFMRIVEQQNLERVQKLKRTRRNNILVGCGLGVSVVGIYLYSMFSVAQEKFLDDFDEPRKVSKE